MEIKKEENEVKYLIEGKLYNPIRFGEEEDNWGGEKEGDTCGDCGCAYGEIHKENCDIERCPACRQQLWTCGCGVVFLVKKNEMHLLPKLIEQQKIDNIEYDKNLAELIADINAFSAKQEKQDAEM